MKVHPATWEVKSYGNQGNLQTDLSLSGLSHGLSLSVSSSHDSCFCCLWSVFFSLSTLVFLLLIASTCS